MFVQNNEVGDVVCSTCISEVFHNVVSSVYSMGVGEDEAHFLYLRPL